jgi:hypothetical protein
MRWRGDSGREESEKKTFPTWMVVRRRENGLIQAEHQLLYTFIFPFA